MHFIDSVGEIIVAGSCLYHFVSGACCILSYQTLRKINWQLYKLDIPEKIDEKLEYCIKMLGVFALWTSFICGVAFFRKGEWFFYVKLGLAGLFITRAILRYFYREMLLRAFSIQWKRSRINVAINFVLSILLVASC